jgi:hypothetical protein
MRCVCLILVVCLWLATHAPALAQESASSQDSAVRIEKLIQDLASPRYPVRARAFAELEKIGPPALGALRKAAGSDDMETSQSAEKLIQKLEEKQLTAKLLAPTKVRLQFKDTPVSEVLRELERQSGIAIQVQGSSASLARKKITLDTGETTFWQAFDLLCREAGLVEVSAPQPTTSDMYYSSPPAAPVRMKRQPLPKALPQPPRGQPKAGALAPAGALQAPAFPDRAGQIKLQVQPVPQQAPRPVVQKVQFQPVGGGWSGPAQVQNGGPTSIRVGAGKPADVPTCFAGAVRIQALPGSNGVEPGVIFRIAAEPRLKNFQVVGSPTIEKALDDQGQLLDVRMAAAGTSNTFNGPYSINPYMTSHLNQVAVHFKNGAKESKTLKELVGKVGVQILTPTEPLVVVKNVLNAAGTSASGKDGGKLEIVSISRENNDQYRVQVRVDLPQGMNPFGVNGNVIINNGNGVVIIRQVQVNGGGNVIIQNRRVVRSGVGQHTPMLVDAKGKEFNLVATPNSSLRGINGKFSQELTLIFQANPGQGEPSQMVLSGERIETMDVPFRFENVPLR